MNKTIEIKNHQFYNWGRGG